MKRFMAFFICCSLFASISCLSLGQVYANENIDLKCGYVPAECVEVDEELLSSKEETIYAQSATTYDTLEEFDWEKYTSDYYYNQLDDDGKKIWNLLEQQAYEFATTDCDANKTGSIYYSDIIYFNELGITTAYTTDGMFSIVNRFIYEHPQYYFLRGMLYSTGKDGYLNGVAFSMESDYAEGKERAVISEGFIEAVADWEEKLSWNITDGATEQEIITEIHDTISDYVEYNNADISNDRNQCAISAIVDKITVCAGYSKSFQMFATAYGIKSICVTSDTHMWNLVNLDDAWYVVDVTWDDNDTYTLYKCNMASYDDINTYFKDTESHVYSDYCKDVAPEVSEKSLIEDVKGRECSPRYALTFGEGEYTAEVKITTPDSENSIYYFFESTGLEKETLLYTDVLLIEKDSDIVAYTKSRGEGWLDSRKERLSVDLTDKVEFVPDEDGRYHYKINGETDITKNGLEYYEEWESWLYFEEGVWISDKYDFVDYDGAPFLVANGTIADISGLVQYGDTFYFLADGQLVKDYTGLAFYDGEWFFVENGILAINYNGLIDYDDSKFLVAVGRIAYEYSGLYQDYDGVWYFIAAGQVQTMYTGLVLYDEKWFYVQNGVLAVDYSGYVDYDGATFWVNSGMLN